MADAPKIFLTRGNMVGMHAPMMTRFASMLEQQALIPERRLREMGRAYLVQSTTSSTAYVKSVRVKRPGRVVHL
jgi:hypothetical protein